MNVKPDFTQLGQVIRELRQELGLNQKELSSGICHQSQISKIESGEATPQATTLYLFSKRLGIDVNTLFELTTSTRMDHVLQFEKMARDLVRKKEYGPLLAAIETEKANPVFNKNPYNTQFLLWHEGISKFHYLNDAEGALELLHQALQVTQSSTSFLNEREMEIMNSIGVIHFETGEYERAIEHYHKSLEIFHLFPTLYNIKVKIRIYYNMAKAYTRLKDFQRSNESCQAAIEVAIAGETLYLLGELFYHIGYNYYLESNKEEYQRYFHKAVGVFKITGQDSYIKHVETLLAKAEKEEFSQ